MNQKYLNALGEKLNPRLQIQNNQRWTFYQLEDINTKPTIDWKHIIVQWTDFKQKRMEECD